MNFLSILIRVCLLYASAFDYGRKLRVKHVNDSKWEEVAMLINFEILSRHFGFLDTFTRFSGLTKFLGSVTWNVQLKL